MLKQYLDPKKEACKEVRRQVKMAIAAGRTLPYDLRTLIECKVPLDKIRKMYRKVNPISRLDIEREIRTLRQLEEQLRRHELGVKGSKRGTAIGDYARKRVSIARKEYKSQLDKLKEMRNSLYQTTGEWLELNPLNLYQAFLSNPTYPHYHYVILTKKGYTPLAETIEEEILGKASVRVFASTPSEAWKRVRKVLSGYTNRILRYIVYSKPRGGAQLDIDTARGETELRDWVRRAAKNPLYQSFHGNPPPTLGRIDWMPRLKVWRVIWYKGAKDIPMGDFKTREEACHKLHELIKAKSNPLNLYQAFHGNPPKRMRKVNLPVPKKGSRLVKIGRLVDVTYQPEWPSRLAGRAFQHYFGDTGSIVLPEKPILATDSKGKNLFIIPDRSRPKFTRRGIIG